MVPETVLRRVNYDAREIAQRLEGCPGYLESRIAAYQGGDTEVSLLLSLLVIIREAQIKLSPYAEPSFVHTEATQARGE